MMEIKKSNRKDKKYQVNVNGNVVHFGQKGYEDYTTHKDIKRKERFYQRFRLTNDINSPLFWSMNVLWNKPSIEESISNMNKKFNLDVRLV